MPSIKPVLPQNKAIRVGIGLLVVVLLAVSAVLLFWFAGRSMFSKNPRFVLRKVEAVSPGWWNGKDRLVCGSLHLKPGESNLFALKLSDLKKTLEAEPSIERASITRILPDTLRIEIAERIPRAFLYSVKSVWVVDGNGVVMRRDNCVNLDGGLPVVMGFKSQEPPKAGVQLKEVQPALDLINMTLTEFRTVRIAAVNLTRPDQSVFSMYYRNDFDKPYLVFMPRKNIRLMFRALVSTLEDIRAKGDPRREIDLRYNGQVVLR